MEENTSPGPAAKPSPWPKIIGILLIIIALLLIAAGAYFTGMRSQNPTAVTPTPQTEVLGTENISPAPTEIPSLADETTPTPTLSPSPAPTSTPVPVNPTFKILRPSIKLYISPTATPTPTIKFQQFQPPLQIQP